MRCFCQNDNDSLREGSQSGVPRVGSSKTIMVSHYDVPVVCFMIFLDDHDVPVVCFMIILDDHDVGGVVKRGSGHKSQKRCSKSTFDDSVY